ncbi:chromosome segregation protein SMC [Luminiphilus syltensis NOR5-1B]|uniref:Chromosome partition protein Smc n=1 Tax=Luminiphilus syltensis NOR5-1B TaxID=565045 RepID=B8KS73_9GAMM|nr:chromosome segregation protein SMC [Luminiphilus syltensis]EED35713.1 chromosome segregation protein SMC [Luminiphilus syltensis NOR5-1B]
MRLKTIQLAGFKSFVDPTTVSFPSNMSAVVGPNGCGKSNVIDAVRWVMGESSAKTLRGESMSDVIFNGTTNRQPVGQASIELVFDNSDGGIGGAYGAYAEISVRRQVIREGGSDYFLNGSKCRRRDITDLFLGTGLGPRSYAIIEQGMISRLIESKPEELRVFIEEAAGISKYKERRRETENRMRRTLENLERLTDLRDELERQLAHLKRQAQAAERYREYKAEDRELKSQLLALQWREQKAASTSTETAVAELEVLQERHRAELAKVASGIESVRVAHADATDQFNEVQAEYYSIGGEVTRVEQALRFEQERREGVTQDLAQTEASLSQAQGHLTADRDRLQQWRTELASLEPQLIQFRDDSASGAESLSRAEEAMVAWQTQWDAFNERAAGPTKTSEVQQSRIVYLEQVLGRLQERIARLEHEREQIKDDDTQTDIEALETRIAEAESRVSDREQSVLDHTASITHCRESIESARQEQDQLRQRLQQSKGQQSSLVALQEAATAEGESARARAWLTEHSITARGSVFESLKVADGWAPAVEQVLGDSLTGVCVDGATAVGLGKLEQLPTGACLVDSAVTVAPRSGTLAELVEGAGALAATLNTIFPAPTLAAALEQLAELAPGESVITPDGHWLGLGWVRLRSGADVTTGMIERRQRLEDLSGDIARDQAALDEVEGRLRALGVQRTESESALSLVQQELKQAVREQADLAAERKSSLAAIDQTRERQRRLESDIAEATAQFESEQRALGESRALLADALDHMERDALERDELQQQRETHRSTLQSARDRARDARDAVHRTDMQAQGLKTQIQTVADAINRLEQQVAQLSSRRGELVAQLPEGDDPDAALKSELEALLAQRVTSESALTAARQQVAEHEHALREAEQEKVAVEHRLQGVHGEIESKRLAQAELRVRIENNERQLRELDAIPAEVAQALPDEASESEWQVKVERVSAKISRLGPINLAAIEECGRASERKEYLDAQNEDLESALATLESAIRKIDKETRSRFRDTFDQVNAGFSELFPRVFGGGTASLEMTGDDLLDTGVAIMARPPGKKNSTIHLLSGGEKAMTAIALVFSIFQLNPAPFCMLDEVDAPLDDANVGRYARLVKEMSEAVQFIFITHNKITMEAADRLMGVTMHEPGVSRLVTVDIDEAAQLAAS